jgi:hypothetical protein
MSLRLGNSMIKIWNKSAASENLDDSDYLKSTWKNVKLIMNISAKECVCLYSSKQNKSLFDKECSQFLDQTKQAKRQWLQDPNQTNVKI